jgi:hypothetical protein
LTKLSSSKELLNEKVLNNTYSYTRQVEERDENYAKRGHAYRKRIESNVSGEYGGS